MSASPFDLGARVSPFELQVGKTYYYRNTSLSNVYEKKVLFEIRTNPGGPRMAFLRNDNGGGPVFSVPIIYSDGQPSCFHEFYDINPKPVQRAIGEIFTLKTPLSSAPGTPANLVRKFLGVQPPKVALVGRKNSRRNRRHRKNRSTRKH
jgi:hypothetical protein